MIRKGIAFQNYKKHLKIHIVKPETFNSGWAVHESNCENILFLKVNFDHSYSYLISITVVPDAYPYGSSKMVIALEKFEGSMETIYYEYVPKKNLISSAV